MKQKLTDPTDLGRPKWSPVAQRRMRFREPPIMWLVTAGVVLVVIVLIVIFWLARPGRQGEGEVIPQGHLTAPPPPVQISTGAAPVWKPPHA